MAFFGFLTYDLFSQVSLNGVIKVVKDMLQINIFFLDCANNLQAWRNDRLHASYIHREQLSASREEDGQGSTWTYFLEKNDVHEETGSCDQN